MNQNTDNPTLSRDTVLSLIFVLFWAGGFTFAKLGLQQAAPFTLLALRYFCAVMLFLPVFLWFRPALPKSAREWQTVVITGLMMQVVFFSFVYHAIVLGVSAGTIAVVASLQPILVGVFAPRITGDPVSRRQWFGLLTGLAGALLVVIESSEVTLSSGGGILLGVCALLTMTFVTLYEKRVGARIHPVSANLIQYVTGLLVTTPLALLLEGFAYTANPELAVALAYLVFANSFISVTILLYLVRQGEVHKVSALFFLVPPSAAVIAFFLLDESFTPLGLVGVLIAAAGVAMVRR